MGIILCPIYFSFGLQLPLQNKQQINVESSSKHYLCFKPTLYVIKWGSVQKDKTGEFLHSHLTNAIL